MSLWSPDTYLRALAFASRAHAGQQVPGSNLPYLHHVCSVAMEVMTAIAARGDVAAPDLAVQCALLHDTVEDTDVTVDDIAAQFGDAVAAGVAALTKDAAIADKADRMRDSLDRLAAQPADVQMVKLADRVTNLQPPPAHWTADKIDRYREEARLIHARLAHACPVLGPRLATKIAAY